MSDREILSVTQDGTCDALSYGEVQVTAINADRSCTDTKTIKVYNHATGINISESSLKLKIREKANLVANTLPLETSDGRITWSTDDELVATVDNNGCVRGIGTGACTITATSVDGGFTTECLVTVLQPVEALSLEKHTVSLRVGETDYLYAQITPATANNKKIEWSSSDDEVTTVDSSGNITALKGGEAWIKAVSIDNAEAKDSCKVTVIQPVTGITLSQDNYSMLRIGETLQLEATVSPENALNKEVRWSSSNENVCLVINGLVIGIGYGTAIITASTIEGGYTASCTVKVLEKGDADGSGEINNYDAVAVAYYILGRPLNSFIFTLADVNEDGIISISDAVGIIDIIMKARK